MKTIEGLLVPTASARIALVASRFNSLVVDGLIAGARDALVRHGVSEEQLTLVRVPGAWEIPWACRKLAESGRVEAIVALGAVVRGATPHFDYVAAEVTKGVAQVGLSTGVLTTLGVLTTDTLEQALERAGGKAGNKGAEAALAALELLSLGSALGS
jgi:6,7-dimethyl-8-ribityllumazine synthase